MTFDPNPIYRKLYHKYNLVEISKDLFWMPRRTAERIRLWR